MNDTPSRPSIKTPTNQTSPNVSVCIPSFNKAKDIGETIDSVLNQTYKNYELIIVDNASTDSTKQVIEKYGDKVKCYYNPVNLGAAYNFNRCISLANYDYILILPADDTILPTFLEKTVRWLEKYPKAGFAATRFYTMDKDSNIIKIASAFANSSSVLGKEYTIPRILNTDGAGIVLPLFRKKYLEAIGGFRTDIFFGDVFVWLQIGYLTDIVYITEPLMTWRYKQSSSMTTDAFKDNTYFEHKLYEFEEIYKFWGNDNIFLSRKQEFFRQLLKHNKYVLSLLEFPLRKRLLLRYLGIYLKNHSLNLFSPRELLQILIILVFPRNISLFLYEKAIPIMKKIFQHYSRNESV